MTWCEALSKGDCDCDSAIRKWAGNRNCKVALMSWDAH